MYLTSVQLFFSYPIRDMLVPSSGWYRLDHTVVNVERNKKGRACLEMGSDAVTRHTRARDVERWSRVHTPVQQVQHVVPHLVSYPMEEAFLFASYEKHNTE